MSKTYFIDTNVFIYALDQDSSYHLWARRYINDENIVRVTAAKNLTELVAVLTKGGSYSLSHREVLDIVRTISSSCLIYHSDSVTFNIFVDLVEKFKPIGVRAHDFEIASIALGNGVTDFVTANRRDFVKIRELNLVTPA